MHYLSKTYRLSTRNFIRFALWIIACGGALCGIARADNWAGWRGPTGSGFTDQKDLPLTWDGKKGDNICWKSPLGGTGHSSPIVWGDRVFITSSAKLTREQENAKEIPDHYMVSYNAKDGKELWRTKIDHGKFQAGYDIYAVPTPVTDGKAVYAWFGSSVMAAVDFDGKLLWRKEVEGEFIAKPNYLNPGIASSPVLYQDTMILLFDQGGGHGFIQGIDKQTGDMKWEQKRTKFGTNNTTPILIEVQGKPQLVVSGAGGLQALNPANGEPIWWCQGHAFGESPIYAGGLVISEAPKETLLAVDPTGEGDVTKTHIRWQTEKTKLPYSSPVACGDYIYRIHDKGIVECWELKTGKPVFSERLEGVSHTASPIATADGRVYLFSAEKTYVLKAGPTLEILATNDLHGEAGNLGASPAVADSHIYYRDYKFVYCIGQKF